MSACVGTLPPALDRGGQAGERLVTRTADDSFPMGNHLHLEAPCAEAHARDATESRDTRRVSAWAASFIAFAIRRANRKGVALLKRVLEGSGQPG